MIEPLLFAVTRLNGCSGEGRFPAETGRCLEWRPVGHANEFFWYFQ